MTPAQSHIVTRLMGCVPDLSTLEFAEGPGYELTGGIWFDWNDNGISIGAHVSHDASCGWICATPKVHIQKYVDLLPGTSAMERSVEGAGEDDEAVLISWYTPTLDDLLPF